MPRGTESEPVPISLVSLVSPSCDGQNIRIRKGAEGTAKWGRPKALFSLITLLILKLEIRDKKSGTKC